MNYYVETEKTHRFGRVFKSRVAAELWVFPIGQRMAWQALWRCNPRYLERINLYEFERYQ